MNFTIRNARFADATGIFALIKRFPALLLPRPLSDIVLNIDRFIVAEQRGRIVGTVSWAILPEIGSARHPSIEIKSVCVSKSMQHRGIGRTLVESALERIRVLDPEQAIVLTFSPDFFARLGFTKVAKEKLMYKLYTGCLNCTKYDSPFTCPEVAMSLRLTPARV